MKERKSEFVSHFMPHFISSNFGQLKQKGEGGHQFMALSEKNSIPIKGYLPKLKWTLLNNPQQEIKKIN